jgi:hypothetical protein
MNNNKVFLSSLSIQKRRGHHLMIPAHPYCITPPYLSASSAISLGGLQRIKLFDGVVSLFFLNMGGEVAGPTDPLEAGFAVAIAIGACWVLNDTTATLALLYYRMTLPAVVSTAFLSHKDTLCPRLYRLTNHRYHLLPVLRYKKTRSRTTDQRVTSGSSGF